MLVTIDPLMHITVGTHYFTVRPFSGRAVQLLMRYSYKFVKMEYQPTKGRHRFGRPQLVPGKVYACKTKDSTEFRFHIGQYAGFIQLLEQNYITPEYYTLDKRVLTHGDTIDVNLKPGWVLKDYQEDVVKFILEEEETDNHSRMVTAVTGSGKAQSVDTMLRVPNGVKRLGDIQVGDKVISQDGSATKVNGVFPQGTRDMYRVMFKDFRSTECDMEHLWHVYIPSKGIWFTDTLAKIMEVSNQLAEDVFIELPKSEKNEDKDFPVDPYLLGCIIAQRSFHSDWPSKNKKLFNKLLELYTAGKYKKYLNGSTKQRFELLKGLLGCKDNNCNDTFYHEFGEIAIMIQYLVRSLGGVATISVLEKEYQIEIDDCYPMLEDMVGVIRMIDVTFIGEREAVCISVEHPSQLYVTDDFIVTHNTVMALAAIASLKTRTMIAVLPKYIEKWAGDIINILDVDPKEIMTIQGGGQLRGLIGMALEKQPLPKFTVVSITTIQNYLKAYETDQESGEIEEYGCAPDGLCEILGIGTMIIDETHEHIHHVFRMIAYSHVSKIIALSGTLISKDPFIENIHKIMFPREIRYTKVAVSRYIKVFAMEYDFRDIKHAKIRTTEHGSNTYSQNAFEKSILYKHNVTQGYLRMIDHIVKSGYIKNYVKGDKLAIYAGTIHMCTVITKYMKDMYPNLDVRRYVEKDPYENAIEADIRVTTILSAGTAFDIPNLRVVIMTNNVDSPVSNLQTLGRLRDLKTRDTSFYYVYCSQIPKQVEYHQRKMELFRDRVASIKEFKMPLMV